MRKKYFISCPICGELFEGYGEYLSHVVSSHPDKLWARFRGKVIEK